MAMGTGWGLVLVLDKFFQHSPSRLNDVWHTLTQDSSTVYIGISMVYLVTSQPATCWCI